MHPFSARCFPKLLRRITETTDLTLVRCEMSSLIFIYLPPRENLRANKFNGKLAQAYFDPSDKGA